VLFAVLHKSLAKKPQHQPAESFYIKVLKKDAWRR
jgi:hypothetical protein